jgi:23S rRNA pseudouridine1911/1915/1917 synthase
VANVSEVHSAAVPSESSGERLDVVASKLFPQFSRALLQKWIEAGSLTLSGLAVKPKVKVKVGQLLEIRAQLPSLSEEPENIPLSIAWEDQSLLVVDKPAGLVVHPGAGNPTGTLVNALLNYLPASAGLARAGIVHRLDKDTSGLLLVAKTVEAQRDLVRRMAKREIKREYRALVWGKPKASGTVDAPIARHPVHRTKMAVSIGGREARTHYERLEQFAGIALMRFELETGRTHQIRVHMQHIGHAIVGDLVYGPKRGSSAMQNPLIDRQALHAFRLRFDHPFSGRPFEIESALPADMDRAVKSLGEGASP